MHLGTSGGWYIFCFCIFQMSVDHMQIGWAAFYIKYLNSLLNFTVSGFVIADLQYHDVTENWQGLKFNNSLTLTLGPAFLLITMGSDLPHVKPNQITSVQEKKHTPAAKMWFHPPPPREIITKRSEIRQIMTDYEWPKTPHRCGLHLSSLNHINQGFIGAVVKRHPCKRHPHQNTITLHLFVSGRPSQWQHGVSSINDACNNSVTLCFFFKWST